MRLKCAISISEQDGDGATKAGCHGEVQLAVLIEIADRNLLGTCRCSIENLRLEGTISVS
jgi:hypothetical protein